jgi:branched-chain amino acid transport system substrate-binding protein
MAGGLATAGAAVTRRARATNTPGVTATEIKIGQTMPYSGPVSNYGTIGRAQQAYFAMINAQGGINGRKITLISRDDAYSPQKRSSRSAQWSRATKWPSSSKAWAT